MSVERIMERRRRAYAVIARCPTPPPAYGSPEFLALPEGSPAYEAAVRIAAEAWAQRDDILEMDLRVEVDELCAEFKRQEDAEYRARMDEHRRQWRHLASMPDHLGRRGDPTRSLEEVGREYVDGLRGGSDGGAA